MVEKRGEVGFYGAIWDSKKLLHF